MSHVYSPKPLNISQLKSKILRPATTSNYQCWFPIPPAVSSWIREKSEAIQFDYGNESFELISLNCTEASLPGSSFATNEVFDDYTGVTERIAYRRQYDDRASFTFTLDNSVDEDPRSPSTNSSNYRALLLFELWQEYIADEQISKGLEDPNYFYRMNFPYKYQTPYIIINKFEKDFKGRYLEYKLLQAYPIALDSIPVSYESSEKLQCVVSFNYNRFVVNTKRHSVRLPSPNTPAR